MSGHLMNLRMDIVARPGLIFVVSGHSLSGGIIGEEFLWRKQKLKR